MIQSERQYQVTRKQADRLRRALAALPADDNARPDVDVRLQQAERDAISDLLEELRGQIDEYESLQSGQRTLASIKYLEELPHLLVAARIAAGITPSDLAARLEITEDALLELERTFYGAATIQLITRAMDALGIRIRSGIRLSYPINEGWVASARSALMSGTSITK